jgi:hypothetical protein
VSRAWAQAGSDYTGVLYFTGKEDFADGDGEQNKISNPKCRLFLKIDQ